MKKKWAVSDVVWAGISVIIGLFFIFALYVFLHLWQDSTLRQFIFNG
jgi:hypothetical protein